MHNNKCFAAYFIIFLRHSTREPASTVCDDEHDDVFYSEGKHGNQRLLQLRPLKSRDRFVTTSTMKYFIPRANTGVGEWGWGVEGKQVGSMDEESQVRGCYNITFICTPTNQETVSVLEKTSKQNI